MLRVRVMAALLVAGTAVAAIGQVFKVDTRVVVCNAVVVDKNGHLVTDLKQSNFTVMENGQPQTISVFKREDVPVSMGLVIDNSGSMRDKRWLKSLNSCPSMRSFIRSEILNRFM
jgi:Ca-activated chloride channel family protein